MPSQTNPTMPRQGSHANASSPAFFNRMLIVPVQHSILKKLRILICHAINVGLLKHDPSLGSKRPKIKKIRSWTDGEIEQFKKRWSLGTKQRVAFHLFLNLGRRRSDVVRMAQTHITPERKIRIKQQKTGRELLIPFHRDTIEALDAYDMQHIVISTTAYGKPFRRILWMDAEHNRGCWTAARLQASWPTQSRRTIAR